MTYKDRFVVVIKCRGKIMREYNGTVRIPFGSEYTIYMKNLHSRKAVVDVSVDGDDVLDGNQIVLDPGRTINLKGVMNGTRVRRRFRFINKTKEISDYRGDRLDDGIVRVEFRFEQPPITTWSTGYVSNTGYKGYGGTGNADWQYNNTLTSDQSVTYSTNCSAFYSAPKADEGITVPGSATNQQFQHVTVGALESSSEVIVLRLKGKTSRGKKVKRPITTKTKITCPTCGRRWKSSMKYCGNCSTYIG